jgi:uncharacterized membrane protein YkoI
VLIIARMAIISVHSGVARAPPTEESMIRRKRRREDDLHASRPQAVLLSLLLGMALAGGADAERGDRGARGKKASEPRTLISRDRAAAAARSATGGRVLDIRLERGKRPRYRVKVLLEGNRVRSIGVDARSGNVLK